MKKLKVASILAAIILLMAGLCACGGEGGDINTGEEAVQESSEAVVVQIANGAVDRVASLGVTYSINGNLLGMSGARAANGDELLGEGTFPLSILKEDISNEQDLQTLAISISVTDAGGNEFDAATLQIPSVFGDVYNMEVRYEEDTFVVWQIHDNGIETRLSLE